MRKKLLRFAENKESPYIIEPGKELFDSIKHSWSNYFGNHHSLILELGAGRGDYTVELAKLFPDKNFVGVDYKGDRLWYGSQIAKEFDLKNVAFLRTGIERLEDFFEKDSVEEIWITFPGPRPKKSQANRRLTHPKFLELYKFILAPNGIVHVKTDSELVYEYTVEQLLARNDVEILQQTDDLHTQENVDEVLEIKTHFEKRFLKEEKRIKYLKFRFVKPSITVLTKRRISSIMRALLGV